MRKKRAQDKSYGNKKSSGVIKQPRKEKELVTGSAGYRERPDYAKNADYHPKRDAPLQYCNPFGELLGEPPIGRRAIDSRSNNERPRENQDT
jgi:hypothetical protein